MIFFGATLLIFSPVLAGVMGINERELYWLLLPIFGSSYGYYLFRKDHMDMMARRGIPIYSFNNLIIIFVMQSIIPLTVYIICYFIF